MRQYLLDTGIAQHFINGRRGVRKQVDEHRKRGAHIGICIPVLGELWAGVEGSNTRDKNATHLRHGLGRLVIWPYTPQAAKEFGRLMAELRRIGRPMQQIDVQIAAIALTLGRCTVVTTDSDFQAVRGLAIENWAS
jgi:tRNA(fMet)-specific endonuclease VapC